MRYLFKVTLFFLAIVALAVLLFFWRLAIGPVALGDHSDYLRQALTAANPDVTIDFKDAVLLWQNKDSTPYSRTNGLKVTLYEVHLTHKTTGFVLTIPEAGINFSRLGLLRGILAPTNIDVFGLTIAYSLDPDVWQGQDDRGLVEKLEALLTALEQGNSLPFQIARALLSPPDFTDMTGYLRGISFLDTRLVLTDSTSGQQWQMPQAHLDLNRTARGLGVRVFGDILVVEKPEKVSKLAPIEFSLFFDNVRKEAKARVQFSGVQPRVIAGQIKALSSLSMFDVPLGGWIEFDVDQNFDIPAVIFDLTAAAGQVNPGGIYKKSVQINSAALKGYLSKAKAALVLDSLAVQMGKTRLEGQGRLYGPVARPGIDLETTVTDLPFNNLRFYWPDRFGPGAYDWITKNIVNGVVPKGALKLHIPPGDIDQERPPLDPDAVVFRFNVADITAHYLRPMPPVVGISGQAVLNLETFSLTGQKGRIAALAVEGLDLVFSNIHVPGGGKADITAQIKGPVAEILKVIDYKPLGYPSQYGLEEGSITGDGTARVTLAFPLLKKVKLHDVQFDVMASIDRLSMPGLTDNLALEDGRVVLHVGDHGLEMKGDVTLNGVDFDLLWTEKFDRDDPLPTRYDLTTSVAGADWGRLHLPFAPYVKGPTGVRLSLYGKKGRIVKGQGHFDLTGSHSHFAPLGWDKPFGATATVDFDLEFADQDHIAVNNIMLQSDDLQADMAMTLVAGQVRQFSIPRLMAKDTNARLQMEWWPRENRYRANLQGAAFDARPLLEIVTAAAEENGPVVLPDFDLSARIDRLLTRNNIRVKEAHLSGQYRGGDFTHFDFAGDLASLDEPAQRMHITVTPEENRRKLHFTSQNAGLALRGLDLFNLGVGGQLDLTADMIKKDRGTAFSGQAKVTGFKVSSSTGLSQLLAEKKFAKAQEELQKDGLPFNNFEMTFHQYDGTMEIIKGRGRGPNLGILLTGTIDQTYNEMNLSGTLIPAYGLNSLLSNIPLIGTLLTGGKGQGIFAASYRMRGPLDNPEVKINPLTVLAPGIFRNIFNAIGGGQSSTSLRQQAEEKTENPTSGNEQ